MESALHEVKGTYGERFLPWCECYGRERVSNKKGGLKHPTVAHLLVNQVEICAGIT
jgi:hypothetical protein